MSKPLRTRRYPRLPGSVAVGASVALAAISCESNVEADPSPPPFNCDEVNAGQQLQLHAFLADSLVVVGVTSQEGAFVAAPILSGLEGLRLHERVDESLASVLLVFRRDPPDTTMGRFTLSGTLGVWTGDQCTVTRTFTVTIQGDTVEVAQRPDPLPLGCRDRARIQVVSREGLTVRLAATGGQSAQLSWNTSAGELSDPSAEEVIWTLPPTPGFHQVELLTDHGDRGFGLDHLVIEVG